MLNVNVITGETLVEICDCTHQSTKPSEDELDGLELGRYES